jgi:predicted transcriptional regulator
VLRAKDVMQRGIVGVSRGTSVYAALKLIKTAKVSLMPVLDGKVLCGLAVEEDLASCSDAEAEVKHIMRDPVFVQEDDDLEHVSDIMVRYAMPRLPVVYDKASMVCVGIITSTDVVRAYKK